MIEAFKNTIVVGVDPAPSKGLCVYVDYGDAEVEEKKKFRTHYGATLQDLDAFAETIETLRDDHRLLICWDSPLTMPHDYYERDIEYFSKPRRAGRLSEDELKRDRKARETIWTVRKSSLASIQATAGCAHWCLSQRILGYPNWSAGRSAEAKNSTKPKPLHTALVRDISLIFEKGPILKPGIYVVEVHPALAIQIALGGREIEELGEKGQLSGEKSYKHAKWDDVGVKELGFSKLVKKCEEAFKSGPQSSMLTLKSRDGKGKKDLDPSDHLDAWIAMRLGRRWLSGDGVDVLGDKDVGSFLLPARTFNAKNSAAELDILRKHEGKGKRRGQKNPFPDT